ncbi:MAG: D-alanyl-D-alanine carboxypeptidase [Atopobiaceae bacterium]|nr:D-alanyl-D-alanine carboxypeptidase [Atopobiaceae bacterium]
MALAEAMYGSEALCVEAMNRRAGALGMASTHFENCTGLPVQGQVTTARDVAVMARQMFAHPRYFDYAKIWMEDIDHGDGRITQLVNTNKLLRLCQGCDGGKTGSTGEAGYCVAATACRGDMRLIAVVLGASSGKQRFAIAREMLDYGFANYRKYPVASRGAKVRGRLPVTGGAAEDVALALDGALTLLVNRGDEQRVRLESDLPPSVPAPVAEGDAVGYVRVLAGDREIARIPVVAAESVPARGLSLGRLLSRWPLLDAGEGPGASE